MTVCSISEGSDRPLCQEWDGPGDTCHTLLHDVHQGSAQHQVRGRGHGGGRYRPGRSAGVCNGLGGGGENEARVAAVGGDNFIPSVEDEDGSDVDSCDSSKG